MRSYEIGSCANSFQGMPLQEQLERTCNVCAAARMWAKPFYLLALGQRWRKNMLIRRFLHVGRETLAIVRGSGIALSVEGWAFLHHGHCKTGHWGCKFDHVPVGCDLRQFELSEKGIACKDLAGNNFGLGCV